MKKVRNQSVYLWSIFLSFAKKNGFIPGFNINLVQNLFRRNEMVLGEKKTVMLNNKPYEVQAGYDALTKFNILYL